MIHSWEADLAQSIPQSGAQDVSLQPEDFVVSVSFSSNYIESHTLNLLKGPKEGIPFHCK